MGKQARKEAAKLKAEQARLQDKKINKLFTTPKRKLKIPPASDPKDWSLESAPDE